MSTLPKKYQETLKELKEKIRLARYKAVSTANAQLLGVYWEVGKTIIQQENDEGWGAKTIDRLSADLKAEFADMNGLSPRNLRYMREFAKAYPDFLILQEPLAKLGTSDILQASLAKITWYHHITLLDRVKDKEARFFYISKTIENGWSRNVMLLQIENHLFERQGKTISNFEATLPATDSDLVKETFKSPYVFDFLTVGEEIKERDIERGLIKHLKNFMLELGRGFAYVGNQYKLSVEDDEYFLDLLFYNIPLKCYVVFELKIGDFKPEFVGKLNFYTKTINAQIKNKDDKPTIGILLCKTPNKTVVKYSLQDIKSPIGIAEYQLENSLPNQLKGEIPSIEELEKQIESEYIDLLKPVDKKAAYLKELIHGLKLEPVKEKRNASNCELILNHVVLVLRNSIIESLHEKKIYFLFESVELTVCTDNQAHNVDKSIHEYLIQHKEVREFRIELRLNGFMPAGIKAFGNSKEIVITANLYNYSIGFDRYEQDIILKKLYHELPSNTELESIIDRFTESIIDNITSQLESIK